MNISQQSLQIYILYAHIFSKFYSNAVKFKFYNLKLKELFVRGSGDRKKEKREEEEINTNIAIFGCIYLVI